MTHLSAAQKRTIIAFFNGGKTDMRCYDALISKGLLQVNPTTSRFELTPAGVVMACSLEA